MVKLFNLDKLHIVVVVSCGCHLHPSFTFSFWRVSGWSNKVSTILMHAFIFMLFKYVSCIYWFKLKKLFVKVWYFWFTPLLEVSFPLVNSKNWYQIQVLTRRSLTTWRKDPVMEVYKLGKIIENQEIEIHLILHSLEEDREELRKS